MKKLNYSYFIVILSLSLFTLSSCENDLVYLSNFQSDENVYSSTRAIEVHRNFEYDWENNFTVNINGSPVILPWYSGSPSSFPFYLTQDYKKADGWAMIYNYITDPVLNSPNRDVFIFYNKFRGLLRIFYFNYKFPSQSSKSFAQITINDENTKLLNSLTTGNVCLPLNKKGSNVAYTTGITLTPTTGFCMGWNCFELELSYDDRYKDKHSSMTIAFYDRKIKNIKLAGGMDITGKASYLVTNTDNPVGDFATGVFNSTASVAGKEVEKILFPGNFPKTKSTGTMIIGAAVSSIVSNLISRVAKSWTSTWGKTDKTYKTIDIKASSIINMSGTITENIPSMVYPIQNILIPGSQQGNSVILPISDEPLGVWNIKTTKPVEIGDHTLPTIENYSHYPTESEPYPVTADLGKYVQISLPQYQKSDIELNPNVLSLISDYEVYTEIFYEKATNVSSINENTPITRYWERSNSDKYLDYKDLHYQIDEHYWLMLCSSDFKRSETSDSYFNRNYLRFVAKVTLLLYPKSPYNDDVISLTRTFDCPTVKVPTPSKGSALIGGYH